MSNLLPKTYKNRTRKHICHGFILNTLLEYYKFTQVVGLGGPDINPYCKKLIKIGIKKFEIWENDQKTAKKQLDRIKYPARMRFGDVLKANPERINTLYDLDFTMGVDNYLEHIAKFKERFIITMCIRKIGTERTLNEFFKARGERIKSIMEYKDEIKYKMINTNAGKYIYSTYRDMQGPPMCCIAKIN